MIVTVTLSACANASVAAGSHRCFVVPSAQVRVQSSSGGGSSVAVHNEKTANAPASRKVVLSVAPVSAAEPLALAYSVTYQIASIEDWLALERERKTALIGAFAPLAPSASVVDIELAMGDRRTLFVDVSFPPTDASLYIDPANVAPAQRIPIQWKRPSEFVHGDPVLFHSGAIDPNHVAQGRLGDCW